MPPLYCRHCQCIAPRSAPSRVTPKPLNQNCSVHHTSAPLPLNHNRGQQCLQSCSAQLPLPASLWGRYVGPNTPFDNHKGIDTLHLGVDGVLPGQLPTRLTGYHST